MANPRQHRSRIFRTGLPAATTALAIIFLLAGVASQPAQAQTFHVLHTFNGGTDGEQPEAGLTMDRAGNLYGTAQLGGIAYDGNGYGTVFQLKHRGSGWIFAPLYSFTGGDDGIYPIARVILGPNGTLYGTTYEGGAGCSPVDCGTVFNVRPRPTPCPSVLCPWTESVVYNFHNSPDGANPFSGDLIFDQAGNIYGTTYGGGNQNGVVYELTPSGSGWTESILYAFSSSGDDGANPFSGVIFDNAGNLYGTTFAGGSSGYGAVYQLVPSHGGWTENVLYSFQPGNDGSGPSAGLIFDASGNLYGATAIGGSGGGGTVFKLTPSGGSWTYSTLYNFAGTCCECGPRATLVMDGAGNLYGTTACDGRFQFGSIFKLTPTPQPPWTYTSLHDFTDFEDGANPTSNVLLDASGNLYGTASGGGDFNCGLGNGCGVVWEITP